MGANSKISWTHHTFNPWWGCTKVSAGCANCYAEGVARRFGHEVWGPDAPRRFFGDAHWQEPIKWNEAARKVGERHRVFCASMADVFEDRRDLDHCRTRLWRLIEATPNLDWLILTKRPECAVRLTPWESERWPKNIWLGTTVESNDTAWRAKELIKVRVSNRFLSLEPLLGKLCVVSLMPGYGKSMPDWVIVGGESGSRARPMNPDWVKKIRADCEFLKRPFFFKQWGAFGDDGVRRSVKANGCLLDDREWKQIPGENPREYGW